MSHAKRRVTVEEMDTQVTMERVTPDQAAVWLADMLYAEQRVLRMPWVESLAEEMRRGEFLPRDPIVLASVVSDLRWLLLNGQHRLHALRLAGVTLELPVVRVVCADMEVVKRHYATIDIGLPRTIADFMKTFRTQLGIEVASTELNAIGAAVIFAGAHFAPIPRTGYFCKSRDFRAAQIKAWQEEIRFFHALIESHPTRRALYRANHVAVALVLLRHREEEAREFIGGMAADDGLRQGDPRKALLTYLQTTPARGMNATEVRLIGNAWNCYVEGRALQRCTPPRNTAAPIVLMKTPYIANRPGHAPVERKRGAA